VWSGEAPVKNRPQKLSKAYFFPAENIMRKSFRGRGNGKSPETRGDMRGGGKKNRSSGTEELLDSAEERRGGKNAFNISEGRAPSSKNAFCSKSSTKQ